MKAEAQTVRTILSSDEESAKYRIPSYQRPYRWDTSNAEILLDDIRKSCFSDEKEYFIGSMICIKGEKYYKVVDGQQRLITLTLIMHRLSEIVKDKERKGDLNRRLFHKDMWSESPVTQWAVVSVRKSERDIYLRILKGEEINKSHLTHTQRVFWNNKDVIQKRLPDGMEQNDITKLISYLLKKVFIVFVEVGDRTSAFRLFNVLNARGMSLSDADLLKSLLLKEVSNNKDLSDSVEEKWNELESLVGENHLQDFLKLHIVSERKTRDRVDKLNNKRVSVYDYYKHHLRGRFSNDSKKMLDMLVKSARHYTDVLNDENSEYVPAQKTLILLKEFTYHEWMPALMAFLNKRHGKEVFLEFVVLFEKVYMQQILATSLMAESGSRDESCSYAIEAINRGDTVAEIMQCLYGRAKNDQLEKSLDCDFYDASRRSVVNIVKAVLVRIEGNRHESGVVRYTMRSITIEHILPQNMEDKYWKKARFNEEEHKGWRHKIGNLTLLSGRMNARAKNSGFDSKKEEYLRKQQKTSFEITKEVCGYEQWNMENLKHRHEALKKEIKELWLVKPHIEIIPRDQ